MNPNTESEQEVLTQTSDQPNVAILNSVYENTLSDLGFYLEGCKESYDWRRNIWAGKTGDLRKNGPDAFPWKGAADTEAHIISQRINTYVAMFITALNRANIRAYPVEAGDMARARVVSNFLKWMVSNYIPQFKRQMELAGNYLLEKGIAVTYVGWEREDRTYKQLLTLDQLAQLSPDVVRIILEGAEDVKLMQMLQQQFKGVSDKKAKKILKDLRKEGKAEFPIVRRSVDRPLVEALAADGDFFFPAFTTDPQTAPYCFWRTLMTAQQIRNKVATEGWDEEWAENVIEKCSTNSDLLLRDNVRVVDTITKSDDNLYEIVYAYQRLTDMEDMAEGIYCTVFCPQSADNKANDDMGYAKHELLNGYDDYPVIVTKLSEDDKRLYEVLTVPEQLRGCQWQVKIERDSRIDRNSLTTLPAVLHPAGRPPPEMGPAVKIPYIRQGEISFAPTPQYNAGSTEMEQTQILEADRIMGLDFENPLAVQRQQYLVDKFLTHAADVIKLAFKCYQRFGPDEVFFRVSGVADPQKFKKGDPNENFDIKIMFDVQMNDPENQEAKAQQLISLLQFDKNGLFNVNALLGVLASSIDPVLADAVLQPVEEAQQQVVKQVTDDLSKIYAGIEVGARPNGFQVAMQVIQQYVQQPDVMQRLQSDEAFKARLEKYVKQVQFQMQQAENAQIGKVGTKPAAMGGVQTQGMQAQ